MRKISAAFKSCKTAVRATLKGAKALNAFVKCSICEIVYAPSMAFETFKRQRVRPSDEPYVTIQRKGVIALNSAAFEALDRPEAVELLYDRSERLVGVRKVDPSVEHAYIVRGQGESRGRVSTNWLISGTAFAKYYGITTEVARRWKARIDEGPTVVVDLKEAGTEVVGNRIPRRTEGATDPVT